MTVMFNTNTKFDANEKGQDWITGDIHGCFSDLQRALDEAGFNEDTDRLFCVGDLVDRGPESHLALEWLAKPWFHTVRGNHEDMVISSYHGLGAAKHVHMMNGGEWFYQLSADKQKEFADAFIELPLAIQVGNTGILHADILYDDSGTPFPWHVIQVMATQAQLGYKRFVETGDISHYEPHEKALAMLMWSRKTYKAYFEGAPNPVVEGIDRIYLGHTITTDDMGGVPVIIGNLYFIDSGAFLKYWNESGGHIFLAHI